MRLISIWILLVMSLAVRAQTINLSDSLNRIFKEKATPALRLDTRNSFISGKSVRVFGVKGGVSFGKKLTLGLGYNWIARGIEQELDEYFPMKKAAVRMHYLAPFIEYSFYKKGNWEAEVPLQIGLGKSFLQYDFLGKKEKIAEGNVMLYEPGMNLEYKIMNLIGVGGGVGYRIMLMNNKRIDRSFTSPVYVLKFRLIFDELYKEAKKWKTKE